MTTLALQPDATAGKDAWISGVAFPSGNNYGTLGQGNIQVVARSGWLMQFDVSSLSGATVTDATLSIYQYQRLTTGTKTLRAYPLLVPWGEGARSGSAVQNGECSWVYSAKPTTWTAAGATDAADRGSAIAAVTTPDAATGNIDLSLDVPTVEGWITTNYGFILNIDGTDTSWGIGICSSDYTTDTSRRPKLTVEYTEGGGGGIVHRVIGSGIVNSRAIVRGAV